MRKKSDHGSFLELALQLGNQAERAHAVAVQIENNQRRIKLLEEMARAIYREWFVEFRAPGVKLGKASAAERKATGKDVFPAGWELEEPENRSVQPLGLAE